MNTDTLYTLRCGHLRALISPLGGELRSLTDHDRELIWQGDPAYWAGSAPLLFPFCGRVPDGRYRVAGKEYPMVIHGFLPESRMTLLSHTDTALVLALSDTPALREIYPFAFALEISYTLTADKLRITAHVQAKDTVLPFSFGGHPGFCLPFDGEGFGDAYLEFAGNSPLQRLSITDSGLLGEGREIYPLTARQLPLSPDPAGSNGIFFSLPQDQRALRLISPFAGLHLEMELADFPVLGLWHTEGAPYLCIEPWCGLPSPEGCPDLENKPGLIWLAPGEATNLTFSIGIR